MKKKKMPFGYNNHNHTKSNNSTNFLSYGTQANKSNYIGPQQYCPVHIVGQLRPPRIRIILYARSKDASIGHNTGQTNIGSESPKHIQPEAQKPSNTNRSQNQGYQGRNRKPNHIQTTHQKNKRPIPTYPGNQDTKKKKKPLNIARGAISSWQEPKTRKNNVTLPATTG